MKKVVSIFSVLFFLAIFSTVVLATDPVLYLDAANNPAGPDAWENLGTAGGELSGEDNPPEEDKGTVEIAALDVNMPDSEFYTFKESGQGFGGPGNTVELFLEDWTLELLLRRNGGKLGPYHELVGFQNTPVEGAQGIRLWMAGDGGEDEEKLVLSIHAEGAKQGVQAINILLPKDEWTWVTIVGEDEDSIVAYQDGEEVSEQPGYNFDKELPIDMILIGANSYGERPRTFNGSIALVRVYDEALTEDEIMQNINSWPNSAAVDPDSKLTTTWGREKTRY